MLYTEKTRYGEIKIDKAIISQIIRESIKPFTASLKVLGDKSFSLSENGIFIALHISVSLGKSISSTCESIINFISNSIQNNLQLPIDDIIIYVDSVYTQKGNISKRELIIKYSERQ